MLTRSRSAKGQRLRPGQIVKIDLGNGRHGVGITLKEPLIAFLDCQVSDNQETIANVSHAPIAFTIMVMNSAVTSGRWPVLGKTEIPDKLAVVPKFLKQDMLSGELSIYHEVPELAPHYERKARPGDCLGLEPAAVWEPEHVEDRLRDHFAGVPNKWVEQLKPTL